MYHIGKIFPLPSFSMALCCALFWITMLYVLPVKQKKHILASMYHIEDLFFTLFSWISNTKKFAVTLNLSKEILIDKKKQTDKQAVII